VSAGTTGDVSGENARIATQPGQVMSEDYGWSAAIATHSMPVLLYSRTTTREAMMPMKKIDVATIDAARLG
jgi:predicted 3-demethylubiquinone-9 3-methyltransferase (glyoxalase superfamily)